MDGATPIDDALRATVESTVAQAVRAGMEPYRVRLDAVTDDLRAELRGMRETTNRLTETSQAHETRIRGLETLNMDAIRTAVREELAHERDERARERRRQLQVIGAVVSVVSPISIAVTQLLRAVL